MPETSIEAAEIRDAASVIILRDRFTSPKVLMGQRRAGAVFMPSKFVFPGGAVDEGDSRIPLMERVDEICAARLAEDCAAERTHALQVAAIREVWEETGLILGRPGSWTSDPPPDWEGFAATGHVPSASDFRFVFRAITPPGRTRRFDARFFMVDADAIANDPENLSRGSGELSGLRWLDIEATRRLDLPFITQIVLGEVAALAGTEGPPESVPFFRNDDEESLFLRLGGAPVW